MAQKRSLNLKVKGCADHKDCSGKTNNINFCGTAIISEVILKFTLYATLASAFE